MEAVVQTDVLTSKTNKKRDIISGFQVRGLHDLWGKHGRSFCNLYVNMPPFYKRYRQQGSAAKKEYMFTMNM